MKHRQRFALTIVLVAFPDLVARDVTQPVAPPPPSALLAAIDPETGLLTAPTPEQSRELLVGTPDKTGHVVITQRPDGTVIGTLDTSYLHYTVASIDAAGKLQTDCTTTVPEQ